MALLPNLMGKTVKTSIFRTNNSPDTLPLLLFKSSVHKTRRDTSKADKNSLSLSCTTTTTMKFTLLRVLLDQMWNLFTVPNQIKG